MDSSEFLDDEPSAPPDPDVGLVTSRLKLETPLVKGNTPKAVDIQNRFLVKNLKECDIHIIEKPYVEEAEETDLEFVQRFNTTSYKIASTRFRLDLLKAIRNFLLDVQAKNAPKHTNPWVILPTGECFSDALVMAHTDIPLGAVYFGNIQQGLYYSHWEVSMDKDPRTRSSDKIFANFEYDRNDMVVVYFNYEDMIEDRQTQKKIPMQMFYDITVTRSSIRRIIVDNAVCDDFGKNRTRLHFEVNCPPVIRGGERRKNDERASRFARPPLYRRTVIKHGRKRGDTGKDAAFSDSPFFTIELAKIVEPLMVYNILSRLRARCGVSIEFAHLPVKDYHVWFHGPYFLWEGANNSEKDFKEPPTSEDNRMYREFLTHNFPVKRKSKGAGVMRRNRFIITYLIECLLSRGAIVKDQLCLDYDVWFEFLRNITEKLEKSFSLCEQALEKLVTMIDERKRIGDISETLTQIFNKLRLQDDTPVLSKEEEKEGYQRVRKVIITPTRIIYVVPEMMMSNRVLRKYDEHGDKILRVSFRDDDNQKMRTSKVGEPLMKRRVKGSLVKGITVAGTDFGYLGSSNSQMRDHGAYFMQKASAQTVEDYKSYFNKKPEPDYMPQIKETRKQLGRFTKIESVPKLMARLGQCFTQSRESGVQIVAQDYCTTYDAIGGSNSGGSEYTFSDGVGCVSRIMARKIAQDMKLKGMPSCYQFRFRGLKGVVAVNPELDEIAQSANAVEPKELPQREADKKDKRQLARSWTTHFVFRKSQIKFEGAIQDFVEIVKCSTPTPVNLNKPFINILNQVSGMQSLECHRRMTERIEQLLDMQMRGFATQMVDEHQCRNKLKELPRRVDIDCLSQVAGFELSTEPFFRSLIKAVVKYTVSKQLRKEQIQIPFEKGRTMLGVVDESNQLQYGQVFVQYTKTIRDKFPPPGAAKEVLKGKVLLTKNPCIVAGDVRMFEAVDIPQLRHLVDVIVFSKHGPRPHPDEMAGSDLDGDEYCVIWDQGLFLDHNEEPFDFTAPKRIDEDIETNLQEKMADFYLKYMTQDAVGTISNAFLFASDLYGINNPVCMALAKKNSQAVDFTKSGMPPEELTKEWTKDENGQDIPPEKAERAPDFHLGDGKPVYESPRLIGRLYRELKAIEDVLLLAEDRDEQVEIKIDSLISYPGWEEYINKATEQLARYNTQLRTIMETYGIKTEAEVLTGYICEMRNRISDKDQDDMSFFNTNQVIETKISGLFRRFREQFFEEFGAWKHILVKVEKPFADEENVCHYECKDPTEEMQRKAVAYYRVCYERAQVSGEKKLSFAWLAYDILAIIKRNVILTTNDIVIHGNPLWVMLTNHMNRYIEENPENFEEFCDLVYGRKEADVTAAQMQLGMYCRSWENLDKVLFIITEWGALSNLYSHFKKEHLALLAILYFTNSLGGSIDGDALSIIPLIRSELGEQPRTNDKLPHPERVLFKFFEFMTSRLFARMKHINFKPIGCDFVFSRGEWLPIHKAALKTYYNLAFNLRFDELLLDEEKDAFTSSVIRECEPFTIELPENISETEVKMKLIEKTGVEEIALRRQIRKYNVLVAARGTLESLDRLRRLVTTKPPINSSATGKELPEQLIKLVYAKIMSKRDI